MVRTKSGGNKGGVHSGGDMNSRYIEDDKLWRRKSLGRLQGLDAEFDRLIGNPLFDTIGPTGTGDHMRNFLDVLRRSYDFRDDVLGAMNQRPPEKTSELAQVEINEGIKPRTYRKDMVTMDEMVNSRSCWERDGDFPSDLPQFFRDLAVTEYVGFDASINDPGFNPQDDQVFESNYGYTMFRRASIVLKDLERFWPEDQEPIELLNRERTYLVRLETEGGSDRETEGSQLLRLGHLPENLRLPDGKLSAIFRHLIRNPIFDFLPVDNPQNIRRMMNACIWPAADTSSARVGRYMDHDTKVQTKLQEILDMSPAEVDSLAEDAINRPWGVERPDRITLLDAANYSTVGESRSGMPIDFGEIFMSLGRGSHSFDDDTRLTHLVTILSSLRNHLVDGRMQLPLNPHIAPL